MLTGHYKKDNNYPCYKCGLKPRYKKQKYCYECFYHKYSEYSKTKFKNKRDRLSKNKIPSLEGEIWKEIKQCRSYFISNLCRVKSTLRKDRWGNIHLEERILKNTVCSGYITVKLYLPDGKKSIQKVHRLIAESFIKKINGKDVINHKDGNKLNNSIQNLEWCTPSYNTKHAWNTGLIPLKIKGENHPMVKLNNEQVLSIRRQYSLGIKVPTLTKLYPVSKITLYNIVNRKIWKHI